MKSKLIKYYCITFGVFLCLFSCEQPVDPVIDAVGRTKSTLTAHVWQLEEFKIYTRNRDIPPPLLFSLNQNEVAPGLYDLDDMVLDATDMKDYTVLFTKSRDMITSGGVIDALGDSISRYFVVNENIIRITSEQTLNWRYIYDENARELGLSVTDENARKLIEKANEKLVDAVAGRTPNRTGELIAGILFNSETIQKLINDLLVDAIAGKLAFINDLDPEEASRELAQQILESIRAVDWEAKLTELLKVELEKLNNIDVDAVSESIAREISDIIRRSLTTDTIYDFVFPFIEQLSVQPDESAEAISSLIVNKVILEVFNEENLQALIREAWVRFTRLNEEQVNSIADTLTSIVQQEFVNPETISSLILPVTSKIENTSILKMGDLAKEATSLIEGLVNNLNETFPDLSLAPDYEGMESALKAAFIVAKPVISTIGAEKAADDAASIIISQFLNFENIQRTFVAAISALQQLDPDIIGDTLGTWLANLAEDLSPDLIEFLKNQLSPVLENLNPELTSFRIARALNSFIKENLNEESLTTLIRPLVQRLADINAEAVAALIAQRILSLDIIEDNIDEERVNAILLPVLRNISDIGAENLAQGIIDAVVESGIFEEVITEERVATIISLVIYIDLWENVKIANNFEEAVIVLSHE